MDSTSPSIASASQSSWIVQGIDFRNLFWVALLFAAMIWSIHSHYEWPLRFIHVASGVLLTGADIIMGFLIGPTLRLLSFDARRTFTLKLLPKTLFIFTPLGIVAPTSGWYYAERLGYTAMDYPEYWWVVGALVVSAILAVQGLFVLLPSNIRAYLEMRKDQPDPAKVGRIMRTYFLTVASQGVMQILIVTIMVRMAAGL